MLEFLAIVIIAIHHDDDAPILWKPCCIASQPLLQFAEQVTLSLKGMDLKSAVLRQQARQRGTQKGLHRRLFDKKFEMGGSHVQCLRVGRVGAP